MSSLRVLAACLPLLLIGPAVAQTWPWTRAEATNYAETSHYTDVVAFLSALQNAGAPISVQMIGTSALGRPIPLAIASFPRVNSPEEARRLHRPIVYIQANIHAGEVEGKEAALMILRRLLQEGPKGLLSKLVLVVAPIYNIDGNEMFGPVAVNRPEQDGPASVGHRENGQGLDLNRDAIKAESPEMPAVLAHVYTTWDPDVMMDLHTTDGTRHGWELTYSPPLNPNTVPAIQRMARDEILPDVRRRMAKEDGLKLFDYGNAERRGNQTAWYTFGQEGRYCTNYVGLRNRIAILSEATSYIPFQARIHATDRFVSDVLDWVATHARKVTQATRRADRQVIGWGLDPSQAPALAVRSEFASRGEDTVLLERRPAGSKLSISSRPKAVEAVKMQVYDRFKATKTARFPAAYLIRPSETRVVELLRKHGISVERLKANWTGPAEEFAIYQPHQAPRPFQGHRLVTLDGKFFEATAEDRTGWFVVRTSQPLGILAFSILEPEGTDGAAAWGFIDVALRFGRSIIFPVYKTYEQVRAPMERVK